ncbi:hypothetical protein, partial [Mesorhizobium sp. M2E.F.Ca.ET.166.01.1.1]|uniref:hypothetical protein n=1 Tax=Mesorhizobium sp. M2E.F.Ca.ET.166.01.1.1 TaxID=2500523 RepID=UPI001AEEB90D
MGLHFAPPGPIAANAEEDGHYEETLYNGRRDFRLSQGETMRYIRPQSMEDAVGLLAGAAG